MNSVFIYSLIAVAYLGLVVMSLLHPIITSLKDSLKQSSVAARIVSALLLGAGAILLFRPHQDAFTGLDVSAYRLMAEAMRRGRPLFGTDQLLLDMPKESRAAFLYRPDMVGKGRLTRDLAHAVDDLESCKTRPFYYPLLPLTGHGFDLFIPGRAADYLTPLLGFVSLLALMCLGLARGHGPGMLLAWSLFFATPLPVWIFRGWFPEAVSSALLCLILVSLMQRQAGNHPPFLIVALGLMVSYHVSYLVISLPLLAGILLIMPTGAKVILKGMLLYLLGLIPLLWQTEFICAPYGDITWASAWNFIRLGATHWLLGVYLTGIAIAGTAAVIFRSRIASLVRSVFNSHPAGRLAAVFIALVPMICSLYVWQQKHAVMNGVLDAHSAMGIHLEILLGLLLMTAIFRGGNDKTGLLILMLAALTMPVYLYLKGAEPVGLWSQRRLLGTLILLLPPAICSGSAVFNLASTHFKGWRLTLAVGAGTILVLAAGLLNAVRWPAPWLLQNEKGSEAVMRALDAQTGAALTIMDYHPWSVPFAVMPGRRVLGIGPEGMNHADSAMARLPEFMKTGPVFFVSAYENSMLCEQDVMLVPVALHTASLPRIHSKRALPAVEKQYEVEWTLLKAEPAAAGLTPRTMRRTLGKGVLGYRGPWGRADIPLKDADGENLPAVWSREGSGLIGPIPAAGETVKITLTCAANRMDGKTQTLLIRPPWSGESARIDVLNDMCRASADLTRPEDDSYSGETGCYRIFSENPYNPACAGIKGFRKDLGALIHSVEFELPAEAP